MVTISLAPAAVAKLRRPVNGRGGFQTLLRKLAGQLNGNQLSLDEQDIERLIRYTIAYGPGGFQERTSRVSGHGVAGRRAGKK
jgi:hypothetical protein